MKKPAPASLSLSPKKHAQPPTQPSRHVYDVIVLGTQPGGLLVGALLAKRGLQVLQLDPIGHTPFYEHEGTLFPLGPSLVPPLRVLPKVEQALYELGINLDLSRVQEAAGHALQLILPRERFDHSLNDEELRAEVARVFPSSVEPVCDLLAQATRAAEDTQVLLGTPGLPFPPQGFWDRFRLRHFAKAICPPALPEADVVALDEIVEPASPDVLALRAALQGVCGFLTAFDAHNELGETRALSHLLRGAHGFHGGELGLSALLGQRMLDLGCDVLGTQGRVTPLEDFDFSFSKLRSVTLDKSATPLRAQIFLCAMDAQDLALLLPPKRAVKFQRFAAPLQTRQVGLTLNLLVRARGLPLGLAPRAVVFPKSDHALGPLLVETSPAHPEQPDDDRRILTAIARLEREALDTPDKIKACAGRIEKVLLDELCPFLDRHVLGRSIPMFAAGPSQQAVCVGFDRPAKSYLGLTGLPQRTCFKNLYLTNRQVLPSLGLEGELLAATRLAELIQRKLHKHNPLK